MFWCGILLIIAAIAGIVSFFPSSGGIIGALIKIVFSTIALIVFYSIDAEVWMRVLTIISIACSIISGGALIAGGDGGVMDTAIAITCYVPNIIALLFVIIPMAICFRA